MASLSEALTGVVGAAGLVDDPDRLAAQSADWRGLYRGQPAALVMPASTAEVAAVVRLCGEAGCSIVPQGGNTGLSGGATPDIGGRQVLINLARMNRVREIDAAGHAMTVEAGAILAEVREAADAAGFLFPLSLTSEGSCQIGGNLATNAGGNAVLRYGNTRELTLGLEVVLADGSVWRDLGGLRKNNSGYDLKQLFIGSEGTLGIITAAVLKLFPRWAASETALLAFADIRQVLDFFIAARRRTNDRLVAFELMPRLGLDMGLAAVPGTGDPMAGRYPWYALVQLATAEPTDPLNAILEAVLAEALDHNTVLDGTIAASEAQARRLWALRENMVEAQRLAGACLKHDVSVRISRIGAFIAEATRRVGEAWPADRVLAFGHVGDGNVHFNVCPPAEGDVATFLMHGEEIARIVYDTVADFDGSISAEHGIGRLKRAELARHRPPLDLALMRRVKTTLDPENRMNPGVLFEDQPFTSNG